MTISLGVDVGGVRKGLALVALDSARRLAARPLNHIAVAELAGIVQNLRPDIIAIDSPPRWAPPGGRRQTEVELTRRGIQLFKTPSADNLSKKGFNDWMAEGVRAFAALEQEYPLFDGDRVDHFSVEVFPHASAVALSGHGRRGSKVKWRREVLRTHSVEEERLKNVDLVDAGLAALTGLYVLAGRYCYFGLPKEGVIVLPCPKDDVPEWFPR